MELKQRNTLLPSLALAASGLEICLQAGTSTLSFFALEAVYQLEDTTSIHWVRYLGALGLCVVSLFCLLRDSAKVTTRLIAMAAAVATVLLVLAVTLVVTWPGGIGQLSLFLTVFKPFNQPALAVGFVLLCIHVGVAHLQTLRFRSNVSPSIRPRPPVEDDEEGFGTETPTEHFRSHRHASQRLPSLPERSLSAEAEPHVHDLILPSSAKLIGQGATAEVYLLCREDTGALQALKLMHPHLTEHDETRRRFLREFSTLQAVKSPFVVRVHRLVRVEGRLGLVMDYLPGGDLKSLLDVEGAMDDQRALEIVRDILEGLEALHESGFVHRDMKPHNVLIDASGRAQIADLGAVFGGSQMNMTSVGAAVGTPEYMAPEQFLSPRNDGRSDLYSLGIVLYELLAARTPFRSEGLGILMRRHLSEPVPPLKMQTPSEDSFASDFVSRLLEKKPYRRFQSAKEAIAAIDERRVPPRSDIVTLTRPCFACRKSTSCLSSTCLWCGVSRADARFSRGGLVDVHIAEKGHWKKFRQFAFNAFNVVVPIKPQGRTLVTRAVGVPFAEALREESKRAGFAVRLEPTRPTVPHSFEVLTRALSYFILPWGGLSLISLAFISLNGESFLSPAFTMTGLLLVLAYLAGRTLLTRRNQVELISEMDTEGQVREVCHSWFATISPRLRHAHLPELREPLVLLLERLLIITQNPRCRLEDQKGIVVLLEEMFDTSEALSKWETLHALAGRSDDSGQSSDRAQRVVVLATLALGRSYSLVESFMERSAAAAAAQAENVAALLADSRHQLEALVAARREFPLDEAA